MSIKNFDPGQCDLEFLGYTEVRLQENRNTTIQMLNGDVVSNHQRRNGGVSSRVFKDGQWGFASAPGLDVATIAKVVGDAGRNAEFLASRQGDPSRSLPTQSASLGRDFTTERPRKTPAERLEFLHTLDAHIAATYPDLTSRLIRLMLEDMEKKVWTSTGSEGHSMTPRSLLYVRLMSVDERDQPVGVTQPFGGLGQFEDVFDDPTAFYERIDEIYQHLKAKRVAVPARGGVHDVILDADLAGILAHEAVGHPTEADIVLGGSVAADLVGERVATDLVTMVDFAHTYEGQMLPVPVFMDDEGVESEDTILIDKGVLRGFMHNRETAEHFGTPPTGSARAFMFSDEPLIRMRNTAILPGNSKLQDMIASIDDGYYLMKPSNGQADTTSEFMFGVSLGYEIKNGKLGRAIHDTTISGVAFDMLKTVTMVSDDMTWGGSGYCGKKQMIPVGMGGPAIKCKVHVGGE